MTNEPVKFTPISSLVPKPTLSQVIIEKIREGATLEETKQYYAFLREIQLDEARIIFDADFVQMQGELPEVPKRGRVDHGGGRGWSYAKWEDINDCIKPVLKRHGFALNFDIITETETLLEMKAILRHRSGYSISTPKKLPIDKSGAKNIVQAYGSTQSYCQRYAAIALLNLTSRDEDDDATSLDKLSEEAAAELSKAITDSGRTEEWFCKFAQINELESLAPERFDAALAYVKKLEKVSNAAGQ